MKIVEVIEPINSEKTIMGPRVIKLEFDTETGRMAIDTPAMFADPVVRLDDLRNTLDKFEAIRKDQ